MRMLIVHNIQLYDSMTLREALHVLDDCSWLATKWPNTDLWQLLPVPQEFAEIEYVICIFMYSLEHQHCIILQQT